MPSMHYASSKRSKVVDAIMGGAPTTQTITIAHDASPEFGDSKVVRRMFSLSRAHLYRLGAEGKIKSSVLRQRGRTRGRRLWFIPSVREYLFENMEGATNE
jgi:hypothetical protein